MSHLKLEILDGCSHGNRERSALHQKLDAEVQLGRQISGELFAFRSLIILLSTK